jgi:hypothetical protein
LVTVTLAVKPPCHCEPTVYATPQPGAAAWALSAVTRPLPAATTLTAAAVSSRDR